MVQVGLQAGLIDNGTYLKNKATIDTKLITGTCMLPTLYYKKGNPINLYGMQDYLSLLRCELSNVLSCPLLRE
jgi:hypothetical protein